MSPGRALRRFARSLLPAAVLALAGAALLSAGVRFGDAVPVIVRSTDLERIRSRLNLTRFSVIAAVWLGASEGREVLIAEPLSDERLRTLSRGCESGGFCPDPVGFVASRLRIVQLRGIDVLPVVVADRRIRDENGAPMAGPREEIEGLMGWNGRAGAHAGHIRVLLLPFIELDRGVVIPGSAVPLVLQWNPDAGRFGVVSCDSDDDGERDPEAAEACAGGGEGDGEPE